MMTIKTSISYPQPVMSPAADDVVASAATAKPAASFNDLSTKQLAFLIEAIEGEKPGKLATLDAARKRCLRNLPDGMSAAKLFAALLDWRDADVDHADVNTLRRTITAASRKPSIATVGGLPTAPRTTADVIAINTAQRASDSRGEYPSHDRAPPVKRVTVADAVRGDLGLAQPKKPAAAKPAPTSHAKGPKKPVREGTKAHAMFTLMTRPDGATGAELDVATKWHQGGSYLWDGRRLAHLTDMTLETVDGADGKPATRVYKLVKPTA